MIIEISKSIVLFFGVFIIFIGFVMLLNPKKARETLKLAGSSNFINYMEITIRLIPAISLILFAEYSKFPEAFNFLGWIMIITSLILYVVPRKIHHNFSLKSAEILRPLYFQLISFFAFLFGALIIYNAL